MKTINENFLVVILALLLISYSCTKLPGEPEKLQTGAISGKVTEANTNNGLHGVSITTTPATKTALTCRRSRCTASPGRGGKSGANAKTIC